MGEFWERYSGERSVLGEALISHDPYDQFAWCQGWRFAICDRLVWDLREHVEDFRSYAPDEDAYELEMLREIDAHSEELRYALKILDRFRVWLGMAGQDY